MDDDSEGDNENRDGTVKGVVYATDNCDPDSIQFASFASPHSCTPGKALSACTKFGDSYSTSECVASIPESVNGLSVRLFFCPEHLDSSYSRCKRHPVPQEKCRLSFF